MRCLLCSFVFIASLLGASIAGADIQWPSQTQGQAQYFHDNIPTGTCNGVLKLAVTPDGSLTTLAVNFDHCLTSDRHRFVIPFSIDGTDWKWSQGVGYFQGKLAGRITDSEIVLYPWVFGFRFRAVKAGKDHILFQLGFEHNNGHIFVMGNFSVTDQVLANRGSK